MNRTPPSPASQERLGSLHTPGWGVVALTGQSWWFLRERDADRAAAICDEVCNVKRGTHEPFRQAKPA